MPKFNDALFDKVLDMTANLQYLLKRSARLGERPKRVLVVDDDESIREVLAHRLERQGYETICAETGRQGLALARTDHPDLVVLDIRLPDIDGLAVCQDLDEDPLTCHIPVIVLSGMERPDIIRRARLCGCTYYVRKPYDPNALLVLIEHALIPGGDA
jgi:CheY-like chemotaxis protein